MLCCVGVLLLLLLQESPRWQVVLRALAALEAVLQRGSSQACGEVAVMFQSDPSPVRKALSSPQVRVTALALVCAGRPAGSTSGLAAGL